MRCWVLLGVVVVVVLGVVVSWARATVPTSSTAAGKILHFENLIIIPRLLIFVFRDLIRSTGHFVKTESEEEVAGDQLDGGTVFISRDSAGGLLVGRTFQHRENGGFQLFCFQDLDAERELNCGCAYFHGIPAFR